MTPKKQMTLELLELYRDRKYEEMMASERYDTAWNSWTPEQRKLHHVFLDRTLQIAQREGVIVNLIKTIIRKYGDAKIIACLGDDWTPEKVENLTNIIRNERKGKQK